MARTPTSTAASNSFFRWPRNHGGSPVDLYPETTGWSRGRRIWTGIAIATACAVVLASALAAYSARFSNAAKRRRATLQLTALRAQLERYYMNNGFYPTTDQGLGALDVYGGPDPGMLRGFAPPKYEFHPLRDPWGNPFFYQSDGNGFVLKSLGADGIEGGTGDNADVELPSP